MEHTCILIKPDAISNGNIGDIISHFEKEKFELSACKLVQLNDGLLVEHYSHVSHEPFFEGLKKFMKSRPVVAMVLKRNNAVEKARKLCGNNFEDQGTIRGHFATCHQKNAIHSSDSPKNAEEEIKRFFDPSEIF